MLAMVGRSSVGAASLLPRPQTKSKPPASRYQKGFQIQTFRRRLWVFEYRTTVFKEALADVHVATARCDGYA